MKKQSFFERLAGTIRMRDSYGYTKNGNMKFDTDGYPAQDGDQNEAPFEPADNRVTSQVNDVGELSVDLIDQGDAFVILAFIAGVSKQEMDVEIARQSVAIQGERSLPHDISPMQTYVQELYWGRFERTIELPDEVDIDRSTASEEHGLLTIYLPKIDKFRRTNIKVRRNGDD